MCRIASGTVAALALLGLVAVLTGCSRQRRANLEPSPSALLLWRLGKWHFRRHEDSSALLAYHQAKQVQEQAMTVGSCLTPQLLADIGSAMDSNTSSPVALSQKLEVYEELAFVMESFVWEDHFLQLSDQTEMLKEIGLAAHGLQAVELEMATWKVALRLCLTTRCEQTIRHAELLLRIGVSLSKQPSQDMEKVLDVYEEAEEIFVTLDKKAHPLYAILVHNVGATAGQRGDRKGEKESFEKALDIYRNTSKNYTETYTSLLYEVALAREEMGDLDGSLEAFQEAERAFLHNEHISEKLRLTHVVVIGDMRRNSGDIAGAQHAYEIAQKVHQRSGTLNTPQGRLVQKNLKDIRSTLQQLPQKQRALLERELEVHRRPGQPETAEEVQDGLYLQSAGR
ncbi:unnamed protein product [Durusdinium trenchii]|uniref:Uncharacterized protein n=3 Tax=Durusdinium trenchii TaxID=1381693 RepID=A0ABP0J4B8_9DINO